ncbi:MAG: hypothetical protein AAGC53_22285 [Actinomycetota bacterium]
MEPRDAPVTIRAAIERRDLRVRADADLLADSVSIPTWTTATRYGCHLRVPPSTATRQEYEAWHRLTYGR